MIYSSVPPFLVYKLALFKVLCDLLWSEFMRKRSCNNCLWVTTCCYSSWKASCCLQPFGETPSFHLIHLLTPFAAPDTFPSRKLWAPKKLHFMMFHFFARWDIFCSALYTELRLLLIWQSSFSLTRVALQAALNPGTIYLYSYFGLKSELLRGLPFLIPQSEILCRYLQGPCLVLWLKTHLLATVPFSE